MLHQRTPLHLRGRPVVAQDKEDGETALDMARTTTMATPPWTGQLEGNTTRPAECVAVLEAAMR